MKNLILSSVLVLIASTAAQAQQAVQWKVSDGGNGHWYRLDGVLRSWEQAHLVAVAAGGHLATIQNAAENALVVSLSTTPPPGLNRSCWLGGRQSPGSCEPGCGWTWVTGEPFDFQYWGPGEPNNATGSEDYLHIWVTDQWNDTNASFTSESVVEWSADCNGDGIVDYGQILQGQLVDSDVNGVPDICKVDPCPGDITNGGTVDATDLSIVLAAWGTNGQGEFQADIDNSGLVAGGDLALVLGGWGPCPQ